MNGPLPPAGTPIRQRIAAIIVITGQLQWLSSDVDAQVLADAIVDGLGLTSETAEFATRLGLPGRRRWVTPWEHTPDEGPGDGEK